ncbi:MAG: hypothetical protein ABIP74_02440 [Candidatus Saccharimonas sp.]
MTEEGSLAASLKETKLSEGRSMTNDELNYWLTKVERSVEDMRGFTAQCLRDVVRGANGKRRTLPSDLLKIIARFWRFDPAHAEYEFGGYVYSLLTENPTSFPDHFIGYEWNADEYEPQIDILVRKAKAS